MIALRNHRGISQENLGAAVNLRRYSIMAIEGDRRRVSLGEALAIAAALNIDLAAMYGEDPITLTDTKTIQID